MTTPNMVRGLFGVQYDDSGWPIVSVMPEAVGELKTLLSDAYVDEHRTRDRMRQRDPMGIPDEVALRRHMLQVLDLDGELRLGDLVTSNEAKNSSGSTSVSFAPAVRKLFDLLKLEPPTLPSLA